MKVVALISGGKDSCFNMLRCLEEGHQVICLANLFPPESEEIDSYMYQSVGSEGIELFAEALGLSLFRRQINGKPKSLDNEYVFDEEDEVEDLYQLLSEIKHWDPEIEGVSVGAINSTYQKKRVEDVCQRLGLTPLCYLWEEDQLLLLDSMISAGIEAIIIKVASLGLNIEHLGKSIKEIKTSVILQHKNISSVPLYVEQNNNNFSDPNQQNNYCEQINHQQRFCSNDLFNYNINNSVNNKFNYSNNSSSSFFQSDAEYSNTGQVHSFNLINQQQQQPLFRSLTPIFHYYINDTNTNEIIEENNINVFSDNNPPDINFLPVGVMHLARTEEEADAFKTAWKVQVERGAHVALLNKEELCLKFPFMRFDDIIMGTLGLENEGIIDTWQLLSALREKNITLGVRYLKGDFEGVISYNQGRNQPTYGATNVEQADSDSLFMNKINGVVIRPQMSGASPRPVNCYKIFNAAGPWAGEIAKKAGIGYKSGMMRVPLPIVCTKRTNFVVHAPEVPTLQMPILMDSNGIFCRPDSVGHNYICGKLPTKMDAAKQLKEGRGENQENDNNSEVIDYNEFYEQVWPLLVERIPLFKNAKKQTNRIHLPPLLSASSNSSQQQINYLPSNLGSPQKYEKNEATNNEKKLKERPKEKLCDTKKFTMADLVKWRPRTENTFRKKWSTKRKNDEEEKETISSKTDDSDDLSTANSLTPKKGILEEEERKTPTSGPRVRINEQGEMVVDEDSLIVMQNPENTQLETVINDDVAPKKLTSMSFRKRSRGSIWGVLETDLFYEVLAATGTDFGLMHEFIPNRSRIELKQKFNREHRVNPKRMDEALRNPVLLDGRLRQRVERFHAEMAK
ncbi:DAO domain-containing protein [Meloidogyne graminicola]|uniref:Diphthine--ammonia ligase n=1 Tax=Meloidogyne graminicola TaxID=189291 RepID=A0A8T0A335_9BILA|nr:DAO domain-containing protein [Meloidogyne graminicola]